MSVLPEMPRQRTHRTAALSLQTAAVEALQPLHDTLLDESPDSFDGLVGFAIDRWHDQEASAVFTIQPSSTDTERYEFYRKNIQKNRIDLAATALGDAMDMPYATYLQSRMNPSQRVYSPRVMEDGRKLGAVQSAHNMAYGRAPAERKLAAIWQPYTPLITDILHDFDQLDVASIGDTLELDAPTTPNAFTISWDVVGSSLLAQKHYGPLRNYLLDAKTAFNHLASQHLKSQYHDNGDGQDIAIWLPPTIDRAESEEIHEFGQSTLIPLLEDIQAAHRELVEKDYADIHPELRFVVDLANIEKNKFEGRTARQLWEIDKIMSKTPASSVSFSQAASAVIDIVTKTKK